MRSGSSRKNPAFEHTYVEEKPQVLSGWLEKKSPKKIMGNEWQKRYCVVDETSHSLVYYKSDNTTEKPQGSIDLLMVVDINVYDKGKDNERSSTASASLVGSDSCRFNIDMGDGTKNYKFKCETPVECEKWMSGLNEWRDWCLLNMSSMK